MLCDAFIYVVIRSEITSGINLRNCRIIILRLLNDALLQSKSEIIKYICFNGKLDSDVKIYVLEKYPILIELKKCMCEFRRVFETKNPVLLRTFIDNYSKSEIKKIQGFIKGIIRDFDAVDLAVSSNLSNGFVEGINNKIKLIKRVMSGRCSLPLLKAKIIFPYYL